LEYPRGIDRAMQHDGKPICRFSSASLCQCAATRVRDDPSDTCRSDFDDTNDPLQWVLYDEMRIVTEFTLASGRIRLDTSIQRLPISAAIERFENAGRWKHPNTDDWHLRD